MIAMIAMIPPRRIKILDTSADPVLGWPRAYIELKTEAEPVAQPLETPPPTYISTKEASWLLDRSDATIRRWCHSGKLRYRQVGKDIDVNFLHAVEVALLTVPAALAILEQRRAEEQNSDPNTSGGDTLPPGRVRRTSRLQHAA